MAAAWRDPPDLSQDTAKSACALLRDLPARPTQRTCKTSTDLERASAVLDQGVFEGAVDEQEHQLLAFQETWHDIHATLKELRHHTLGPVFSQLQQWVAATSPPNSSQEAAPAATAAAAGQLLPTVALSVASSTNTAETYAQLIVTLKQKGHPVALITSRETCAGLASVVGSAMRQFTGGPTPADDVPALAAWWDDERQRHCGSSSSSGRADGSAPMTGVQGSGAASAAAAATPSKRGGEAAAADAATPPATGRKAAAAAAAATPSTAVRELRARPQRTPGQRGGQTPGAGPGPGAAAGPALQAPVLLLQEADGGDMESLEELVLALGEARRAGLPLVLVLGITSSHAGLLQLLPNSLLRRVQLLLLALPPSRQQLALLTRSVLLKGPLPRLVLGPRTAAWLLQHFRDVDCSASTAERALQLACVEHFMQQPLSCLAPAAASGQRSSLAAAVAQLPQHQLLRCCSALLAELQEAAAAAAAGGTCAAVTAAGVLARASPPASKLSRLSSVSSPGGAAAAAAAAASSPHLSSVSTALSRLQALVQLGAAPGRTSPGSAAPVVAAAAGVLEQAVWAAMQAFARWRLGVLLLSAVAAFTGASEQDASLQLPAAYAAASQSSFLTVSHRGSLSPCGLLLLKLLGSCSPAAGASSSGGGSSSSSGRARIVAVEQLADGEAVQLLQKLAGLLQGLQPQKQQQQPEKSRRRRRGAAGHGGSRQAESDSSSSSSSSSSESDSQNESDSDSDDAAAEAAAAAEQDAALFSCADVQHLQQALAALTTAGSGSSHQTLSAFTQQFQQLLVPLPELLRPAAAAAAGAARDARSAAATGAGGEVCTPSDATMTGTPCPKSMRGKAAGAAAPDTLTPGGLASRLRRQVRFAPGTPDHSGLGQPDAAAAAAGAGYLGGSVQSTPEAAAVAGHIKTPSKRGSGGSKPKKKLFDPAALAAAAADANGRRRKAKKGDKNKPETGEIAGSSAAALAAVAAAAAAAPGLGQSPVVGKAVVTGNKRSERLLQLMTATAGGGGGGKGAPGGGGGGVDGKGAPGPAAARQGLPSGLNTPPAHSSGAAAGGAGAAGAAAAVSPRTPLSPRGAASAARRAGRTAGGGDSSVQDTPAAGDMMTSPARVGRSNSRLSRRSEPAAATDGSGAAAAAGLAAMDSTPTQQQQQQQQECMQVDDAAAGHEQPQQQHAAMTLGAVLARLLRAVIPKLLLEWSSPTSSSSSSVDATLAAAGAAAFTFDDVAALSSQLCPAPRVAVHAALVAPSRRLQGHPQQPGPSWEDTCLAYLLLQQQREDSLAVADWFGLFCQAQGLTGFSADDGSQQAEDGAGEAAGAGGVGTGRAVRARARAGRKAKGFAEARADAGAGSGEGGDDAPASSGRGRRGALDQGPAAAAAGTPGRKGRAGTAATPATGSKRGGRKAAAAAAAAVDEGDEPAAPAIDEQQLLEAAARFSQAAAELQLLGVWKATKRRRLAAVQRVFAPESYAAVLAEGADGAEWQCVPDHEYE